MESWRDLPTAADYAQATANQALRAAESNARTIREETAALRLAEWKLECLGYLAQGIIEAGRAAQYGRDINSILEFTQEDMDSYLMEGWHD